MPTVVSNGIRIHYEEQGSGDPLILIMGLGAPGSRWKDHAAAYEKYFRCILMDNRGAGESDRPLGPYTTRKMADDTAGLMLALGIEKPGSLASQWVVPSLKNWRSLTRKRFVVWFLSVPGRGLTGILKMFLNSLRRCENLPRLPILPNFFSYGLPPPRIMKSILMRWCKIRARLKKTICQWMHFRLRVMPAVCTILSSGLT